MLKFKRNLLIFIEYRWKVLVHKSRDDKYPWLQCMFASLLQRQHYVNELHSENVILHGRKPFENSDFPINLLSLLDVLERIGYIFNSNTLTSFLTCSFNDFGPMTLTFNFSY